jgi:hypothetical protein
MTKIKSGRGGLECGGSGDLSVFFFLQSQGANGGVRDSDAVLDGLGDGWG